MPRLLRDTLIAEGVSPDRIELIIREPDAIDHGVKICGPGDLLLLFVDQVTRSWKQVIYAGGRRPEEEAPRPAASVVTSPLPPAAPAPSLASLNLVRDERGVRLAGANEEAD